jgi:NitT/TauT family transport system substrate-binding protein
MKRALFAFSIAASVMLSGFASAAEKLTVGITPAISNAPLYVAKARGIFEKHGLDVEFVEGNGPVLMSGVVSGAVDLSTPTMTTLLQALDSGLDLSILAGFNIITKAQQDQAIVLRKGVEIAKASDFEGKTVGISTVGATMHVMFVAWLTKNGVDPTKVRFVEIPFPQMGDVLKQGTVDAVATIQPFTHRITAADVGTMGPNFTSELPEGLPLIGFVATNTWLADRADTVKRFRAALQEATDAVLADKEAAKADANTFLKMPPEVMQQINVPGFAVDMKPELVQAWIDMMKPMGLLQTDIDPTKIMYH